MRPLPKPLAQSKTLLFNVGSLVIFLIHAVLSAVQAGGLPEDLAFLAVPIVLVANILLRLVTKQPIDLSVFKGKR